MQAFNVLGDMEDSILEMWMQVYFQIWSGND